MSLGSAVRSSPQDLSERPCTARILIVDDVPSNLVALEATLQPLGCEVVCAYSGQQALKHLNEGEFAVILLDLHMPDLDGVATASLIRKRAQSRHTPIIFVTADDSSAQIARAYEQGAADVLVKPFNLLALRNKVSVFVTLHERGKALLAHEARLVELERARADAESEVSEQRLLMALEAGKMGVWEWEISSGRVVWSAQLEAIHGMSAGSFNGTFEAFQHDIHPEDRERVLASIAQTIESRSAHHLEYRIIRSDGEVRWLEASGKLLCDASGAPLRLIGVCGDITLRKEHEAQRQTLLKKAERAVRERDDVLAMVSHDLRNPLNVMLMGTQLLERDVSDGPAKSRLAKMHRAVVRMNELISDLLDASRIDAGSFAVQPAETDLNSLLSESIDVIAATAAEKNVEIELRTMQEALQVLADRSRIQQVLSNLLGNAVKFVGKSGRVQLAIRRADGFVEISVVDNGPGIPAENLPRLFERYWHAKQSGRSGAGLGLYIVKGIVDAHGGRLWVESEVGKGTTFSFTLPLVK